MGIEHASSPLSVAEAWSSSALLRPPIGRVAVVTDSVAQVPPEAAERWGISVVPLVVTIGADRYLDGVDLAPAELYRRMRVEKVQPKTSAPSIGQYLEAFRACLRAGAQAVLHVSLSSKLSTAYNASLQAAEMAGADFPDRTIEVLDSRQGAISEGFIAMAAARAAAEDRPLDAVAGCARDAMSHTGIVVSLATLEYLARGGRIGKVAYLMGSLINVRPLITLDAEGVAAPVAKARGENRALANMVDWVAENVRGHAAPTLAVMEAGAPEAAAQLRDLAVQRLHPAEIFHSDFTPVMGVHTGPGLVGLGYYYES
jgi:fatty acid kinase fatty acid binding subunit